jgi:ribose transport system ATP-binding protein
MIDAREMQADDHAAEDGAILVRMTGIGKRFGPVEVLRDVDFTIRRGEVHVLAGENGAGKTTLLKILSGIHTDYDGEMEIDGRPARPRSPLDAAALGVAMIHQELSLVPTMTVADNLMLGRHPTRYGFVMRDAARLEALRALELVGLDDLDPNRPVGSLPVSIQQLIEIAKAIRLDASVVVMDEPTSALSGPEVERLFALIDRLKRGGRGVVYISHRMEEIQRIGDRVTVLRDGRLAGSGPIGDFPEHRLIECMIGRAIEPTEQERRESPAGAERLRVESLSIAPRGRPAVRDVSLTVRRGEILGVAGLQGSGASELLNGLFGTFGRPASGRCFVDGDRFRVGSPRRSIASGVALLTNDRKATGLVLGMSVTANATLAHLPRLTVAGWLQPRFERELTVEFGRDFDLRAPSLDAPIATLSGGNQQKVALAKWLMTEPRVLLLDEPTRGVDVGAKREIYRLMSQWTDAGISILLVTSELPELLDLSDRVIVMHRGRITARYDRDSATPESVLAAAMGREQEDDAA